MRLGHHPVRLLLTLAAFAALTGCGRRTESPPRFSAADSIRIIGSIQAYRAEIDSGFRYSPDSPFRRDTSVAFGGLKWFPPSIEFVFQSTLTRFAHPGTVIVYGTKGEERQQLKYGYFEFSYRNTVYQLNVYKEVPPHGMDPSSNPALSVWFTDETTGKETYHVGRYVEVGSEIADPAHLYIIDFNKAYNPYCAYSSLYSCAVPRREDHLAFAVRAGEMNYHR